MRCMETDVAREYYLYALSNKLTEGAWMSSFDQVYIIIL